MLGAGPLKVEEPEVRNEGHEWSTLASEENSSQAEKAEKKEEQKPEGEEIQNAQAAESSSPKTEEPPQDDRPVGRFSNKPLE